MSQQKTELDGSEWRPDIHIPQTIPSHHEEGSWGAGGCATHSQGAARARRAGMACPQGHAIGTPEQGRCCPARRAQP
jgi:hypothetical protein